MANTYYTEHSRAFTILERPLWGVRCIGYKDTKEWENCSEFKSCLNVDSNDECLSEMYGIYAFEYDGMYIGVPNIYKSSLII